MEMPDIKELVVAVKWKKVFKQEKIMQKQVQEVRKRKGNVNAVIATSGGVDSTVCAVLTHRTVRDRLVAVFIDDGLMREGEAE